MVRNEEVENIKEKMTKYIEFYKSVLTNLEKINDKVMDFDKKVYNKRFREFFENNHTDDISIWLAEDYYLTIHNQNNYSMRYDIYLNDFTYTPNDGIMERINGEKVKKVISDYIEKLGKTIEQMTEEKNDIEKILNKISARYEELEEFGEKIDYTTRGIIKSETYFYLNYGNFSHDNRY